MLLTVFFHNLSKFVIAETEDDLIKRLNQWKDNVDNRCMIVNMNKTKVMISGERQKVTKKAVRWPHDVCGRGIGNNSIQCTSCQKWLHRKCSGIIVGFSGDAIKFVRYQTVSSGLTH